MTQIIFEINNGRIDIDKNLKLEDILNEIKWIKTEIISMTSDITLHDIRYLNNKFKDMKYGVCILENFGSYSDSDRYYNEATMTVFEYSSKDKE